MFFIFVRFLDLTYEQTSTDTISITLYVSNNNANHTAPDYETFDTLYLSINITDLNTLVPEFESKKSTEGIITRATSIIKYCKNGWICSSCYCKHYRY